MSGINAIETDASDDSTGAVVGLSDVISSSVSSLPAIIMAVQGNLAGTSVVKTPLGTVATTGVLSSGSLWLVVVLLLLVIGAIFLVVRKPG